LRRKHRVTRAGIGELVYGPDDRNRIQFLEIVVRDAGEGQRHRDKAAEVAVCADGGMNDDAAVGGERAEFGGAVEKLFYFSPGVLGVGGDVVFAVYLAASGSEMELEKECEDGLRWVNGSGIGERQWHDRVVRIA